VAAIGFEVQTGRLNPSTYVVSVTGEIDSYTSPPVEQELEWIIGDGAKNAVIDLTEVGFIDSTALRVFLKAQRQLSRRGGELILVSDDRRILRTLEITGLSEQFTVKASLAEAIARVGESVQTPGTDGEGPSR
jgi:anti-anti-sigma factor